MLTTPDVFRRYLSHGLCPTGACLPGKPNKCFVCPFYVMGPSYKSAIAAHVNLIHERIDVCLAEIITSRMNHEERRAELELLLQEYIAGRNWFNLLAEKDRESSDSGVKIVLYSQTTNYKFENLTPIGAAIQRAIDIKLVPETYTEHMKYVIREMIERFFSKVNDGNELKSGLSTSANGLEYIQKSADFFLSLIRVCL